MVSQAISTDWRAVAQAPTGILMGPEAERRRRLTHPATVLMKLRKEKTVRGRKGRREKENVRLLEDVLLNVLLLATVAEHLRNRDDSSHSGTERRSDLTRVNVLVELVRVGDSGHHERLSDRDERPEGGAVDLRSDVVGNTESLVGPTSRDCGRRRESIEEAEGEKETETYFVQQRDGRRRRPWERESSRPS
jgi:hypothetical protein